MTEPLKKKIIKKIHGLLIQYPGLDSTQLSGMMSLSQEHVERYLTAMIQQGYIIGEKDKDTTWYYPKQDQDSVRYDRRAEETRKAIYDLIKRQPGLHLNKIAELLDMGPSLALYHLNYMEKHQLVTVVKDEFSYYKRFYVKESRVGVEEKKILSTLRQEALLPIVLSLIRESPLRHKEILKELAISPPSLLSYRLNKLVENDIVEVVYYGREKGYRLKHEKMIINLIRKYQLGELVDGFTGLWKDLEL
jgi:predicted transcriptional regulator